MQDWRAFNYTYLVIYPTARGEEVVAILGPHLDATYNYQAAADRAAAEVKTSQGRDLYFAWFNRGSSLTGMQDYANAAVAFDAAFANYTAIPERQRPWRMLWYQTSPYFAYFYSQRFQDVINLADQTLQNMSEPVLEESYYWRAKAEAALGNVEAAIADYRRALTAHPGFTPAIDELRYLGEDPDA
jgi:tetratricopeptide (TPR) repeat protein